MTLRVRLGNRVVGRLARQRDDLPWVFAFDEDYLDESPRPVLGQAFEDDPHASFRGAEGRPPAFFANLLPEGALRRFYEAQFGTDEAALLGALGGDLPGAVRVEGDRVLPRVGPRFSLAGVQPKLSAMLADGKVTLPAGEATGGLIAKLPDRLVPNLPSIEFSTTKWARACGVVVSDFDLRELGEIPDLPEAWASVPGVFAFTADRFDRPAPGRQVHIEDFAQVFDRYPEARYPARLATPDLVADYRAIGAVIASLCPLEDLRAYTRRLVFMVLSGNADLHLKNWSLYYPDRFAARLSPAYDLVANVAIQHVDIDTTHAALRWCGDDEPRLASITLDHFLRFAPAWMVTEAELTRWVVESAAAVRQAWSELRDALPLESDEVLAIDAHLAGCALV